MKDEKKDRSISRREFMGATAAVAAFTFVPKRVLAGSAGNKLNIAGIGVGGRGAGDLREVESENIVALCDVDLKKAKDTIRKHTNAKVYRENRKISTHVREPLSDVNEMTGMKGDNS